MQVELSSDNPGSWPVGMDAQTYHDLNGRTYDTFSNLGSDPGSDWSLISNNQMLEPFTRQLGRMAHALEEGFETITDPETQAPSNPSSGSGWSVFENNEVLSVYKNVFNSVLEKSLETLTSIVTQGLTNVSGQLNQLSQIASNRLSPQDRAVGASNIRIKYVVLFSLAAIGSMLYYAVDTITSSIESAADRIINTHSNSWQNKEVIAPPIEEIEYKRYSKEVALTNKNSSQRDDNYYESLRLKRRSIKV